MDEKDKQIIDLRAQLQLTLLHLETFHSLLPKGEARGIVWSVIKDGRKVIEETK